MNSSLHEDEKALNMKNNVMAKVCLCNYIKYKWKNNLG